MEKRVQVSNLVEEIKLDVGQLDANLVNETIEFDYRFVNGDENQTIDVVITESDAGIAH